MVKREFKKIFFVIRDLKVSRNQRLLELITDVRDFTTLYYVILRRETSGRFIKTENIKCDFYIIIVTTRKASVTTKGRKVIYCAIHVLCMPRPPCSRLEHCC